MKKTLSAVAVFTIACAVFIGCGENKKFAVIGTGGLTGVYYPVGGFIASMVNKNASNGLKVTHQSTGGSVFNINAVISGDIEFGIAQSDRQYQAGRGLAEWKKPQTELRAVFSIHSEAVTLVVADDAKINKLSDLKGKHINIGNPGSGQRQNAIDALSSVNLDTMKDLNVESVKSAEGPSLLQDGRIDGFFFTVGHPNGAVKEVSAGVRKVKLLPIPNTDAILKQFPYYAKVTIAKSLYPNILNTSDIETFGVKATLVTSSKVSDEVVYELTKAVFENIEAFKKLHPALATLKKENMLKGLSVPLHNGAQKYFTEIGLK